MDDRDHAVIEVNRAAGEAGDASGNADAAASLLEKGDFSGAADCMALAREQSERAMSRAAQAEWRLRRIALAKSEAEKKGGVA